MFKISEEQVRKAIKYLKKDIYDDWYCDLQNYEDLHSDQHKVTNLINLRIVQGGGIYHSQKSILLNIPKGNGAFRYTLELSPLDRLAFHVFGLELIFLLDKVIPFNILSHRKSLDNETLFKPLIEQWNKFENYTRVSSSNKFIIETDVANYFDNIDIEKLKTELVIAASEAGMSSDDFLKCMYLIESVIAILRNISFDGKKGLPQNRDISSFLANIYMRPLDRCLKNQKYFRYVDDIRIIADTRNMVNRTMLSVVETLREYGLSLNGGKTRIIEPGTDEHQKFLDNQDYEAKKLDSMLNSGKKRFVLESFSEIYRGTIDYLEKNKIHERKFRFYANRLVTFLNAKDIFIPKKFKDEISCKLIGGIDGRPDCADQICKLAQAVGPNKLLQKNLVDWVVNDDNLTFEWAVYSVIKTLTIQGCSSKKLRDYCLKMLKDPTSSEPIRGISAVFLNTRAYNTIIKQLSKSNSHFLQRHFLIALAACRIIQ